MRTATGIITLLFFLSPLVAIVSLVTYVINGVHENNGVATAAGLTFVGSVIAFLVAWYLDTVDYAPPKSNFARSWIGAQH
ncbi:MAG TPA: hypothetical protein VFT87_00330 [Candidatus Saccharimonadales bacterium]|nr:hypothetical protein [Candidatus Saccharimonadales bacterium]